MTHIIFRLIENKANGEGAMRDDLFNELVESIKEAGAYLRGELTAARVTIIGEPDEQTMGEAERAPS